jgi:UDP-glucose 4-epimerase
MLEHDLKNFIFSSTAAVYGEPQSTPINESHPLAPINPYGRSKRMVEEIINDLASSDGLRYAILRYFNAAGADPQGLRGERHANESHLIPLVLQVASGKRSHVTLFGQDYPTPDGTCVRDYIHVTDLCDAHLAAMQKLCAGESSMICNLGTGAGYSVQQVIDIARMVTRQDISIVVEERRTGDPAILVADSFFARQKLGWQPKFPDLSTIIQHAWQFALTPCKS